MRILVAAALALFLPASLAGQSVSPPSETRHAEADQQARLADALLGPEFRRSAIETTLRDMRAVMMDDPNIVVMEKECEGIVDAIVEVSRPLLLEYEEVETAVTREEMIALFRDKLTDEEALQLATFYESENGRKLIAAVSSNMNFEQSLAGAIAQAPDEPVVIDEQDFEADRKRAVAGTLRALSPAELREIGLEISRIPAFPKMQDINPLLASLRLDIATRDLIPGFDERINEALLTAVETRLAACDIE